MTSANPPIPAPAPRRELEPTHACIRCGREGVPADAGLCELCNPLELSQPAATQMHGIAALGILVFIVLLFIVGRAVITGAGPFTGEVAAVSPYADGLAVTVTVTNQGTKAGAITCWIAETPMRVGAPGQSIQSPLVQPGQSATFTEQVTKLGTTLIPLSADCSTP
jgi:hypothetical protein